MKIKYTKERLNINLKMGLFFIVIGIILLSLSFVTGEFKGISLASFGIGLFAAGLTILVIYHFEKRKKYLTLKDGVLVKNTLIPKKIKLSEISSIREVAGDIILTTEKGEFIIHNQITDKNSLSELKNELNKLNITWN